ncbi:hypothetical protein [Streptomyces sp. NBC_01803]|uniref:hypothetical protein n=1 Tax=Streptomyces sp. NBC_01803 TaxID=2975946 RepID=UPI002DDC26F3|nr:hypothetical protein [Streptomyces sp. NBC_01803]WSA44069.1 hypothetical protein OIE51_07545 [Streptomyces sp. NBC_01803]
MKARFLPQRWPCAAAARRGHGGRGPTSVVRETFRRYATSAAVTEYEELSGRDRLTAAHEGWEEIADHALDWAARHGSARGRGLSPPLTPTRRARRRATR